jgi:uncharacterized protein YjbI with pentapeptide repeats
MDTEQLKEVLESHLLWLKDEGGARADLHGADLCRANLYGADLDFSVLPFRCGGLQWKIDRRIAAQIAYHFCSMECGDADFILARDSILDFANQFHRAEECGRLGRIL